MYIPSSFAETDRTRLFDFIEQHNFGLLVSHLDNEPFATHLPLLLDRQAGPSGTLVGHIAQSTPNGKPQITTCWSSFPDRMPIPRPLGTRQKTSCQHGTTSPFTSTENSPCRK